MKIKHNDIEITYEEEENKWCFTLRGRDRAVDSLAQAREIIDRPVANKKSEFKRIPVWVERYGHPYEEGEITGVAAPTRWNRSASLVWVNEGGRRTQKDLSSLFVRSEKNDAVVKQIAEIDNQATALSERRFNLTGKLKHVTLPKEDETAESNPQKT